MRFAFIDLQHPKRGTNKSIGSKNGSYATRLSAVTLVDPSEVLLCFGQLEFLVSTLELFLAFHLFTDLDLTTITLPWIHPLAGISVEFPFLTLQSSIALFVTNREILLLCGRLDCFPPTADTQDSSETSTSLTQKGVVFLPCLPAHWHHQAPIGLHSPGG
ncbi:hypothetical protein TNIN_302311 [Trichonephila inaurata madagascariensis]|uniref:Uncharacterized protein n=1 Tax=Trichonephila inaurata madagascariensis TaxID=2747483 RepID=A0A8X7CLI9_9ARAC|nr:hypothetical protein TNIN_302311 [Trichonephila inaurata madagascariensis]